MLAGLDVSVGRCSVRDVVPAVILTAPGQLRCGNLTGHGPSSFFFERGEFKVYSPLGDAVGERNWALGPHGPVLNLTFAAHEPRNLGDGLGLSELSLSFLLCKLGTMILTLKFEMTISCDVCKVTSTVPGPRWVIYQ